MLARLGREADDLLLEFAGDGDQPVLALGNGQAHRLGPARAGVEVVELAAQAVDVDAHRGIERHLEAALAAEHRLGDLDLLGRLALERAGEQIVEQVPDRRGAAERAGGAQALGLGLQLLLPAHFPHSHKASANVS